MQPFRKLGPYDLVERLAVGGMAEIYVARARGIQGFEKEYVLKLIHPKYVGDTDFIRMLVDEAKLVGQLTHSNIAQVIDLGVDGESYYILMEYVRGRDLYQILREAWEQNIRIPIDVAVFIAGQMAQGLFYAHTAVDETGRPLNIVHRDISPQNVLISYQGEVKILDFGVAKAALGARPETQAGIIKGKFRYMSPEQAWGRKLDGRSDLFSVGLCLYEMLTGQTAYEDDGDMQKTLKRMRDAEFVAPSEHRPGLDPALESVVMRALARDRADRYTTCHAFEVALNDYLHRHSPGFTRMDVMTFLTDLYPDETQYVHVAEPTERTQAELSTAVDAIGATEELDSLRYDDPIGDPDDKTLRQSIIRGSIPGERRSGLNPPPPTPDEDFADEDTELYLHPDELEEIDISGEQTAQDMPTANIDDQQLIQLIDGERDVASDDRASNGGRRLPTAAVDTTGDRTSPATFNHPGFDDGATTSDRTAPHRRTRRPPDDTVAHFIRRYFPQSAAPRAIGLHEKFVEALQSEQGRKILIPILGLTLGLFVLLIIVAVML